MKYLKLSDCSDFSSNRTSDIQLETYISTENMLPNKGGVVKAESIPDCKTTSKYEPHDILLSNIRPYFCKIWYADKEGGCSNDVLVIKAKKGFLPKFLYYVLSDQNFFNYDTVTSKGTKMPRGSKNAIMKYLVPDLDLPTQRRIASILSAYDNLIENNNKRIRLLEQMAENLYKEWFVRFRFPGHEKVEMENRLPKGWRISRIKDFGRIETGKTPSMENPEYYGGDYLFIKTPDMHDSMFVFNTTETLSDKGNQCQKKKLLPVNSIMVSCIGSGGVVSINAKQGHTNQQINSIILHNQTYLEWLYFTCRSLKTTIELFGATGATMTNLSKGKFENLKVIEPEKNIVTQFNVFSNPIFEQIKNLSTQNDNLTRQRDQLLPRLMSGKLGVKE